MPYGGCPLLHRDGLNAEKKKIHYAVLSLIVCDNKDFLFQWSTKLKVSDAELEISLQEKTLWEL